MPNPDGTLKSSDQIALSLMFDRLIPVGENDPTASTVVSVEAALELASKNSTSQSDFLRIAEALSLDMMSHAVGGFAALTEEEQILSIRNIEMSQPNEFGTVLKIVRDIYYESDKTPDRPPNFDTENEVFGKIEPEPAVERNTSQR